MMAFGGGQEFACPHGRNRFSKQNREQPVQVPICSMSQRVALQLLQSLRLPTPSSVVSLQKELLEQQSRPILEKTRLEQLECQRLLIEQVQERLMLQAAWAADSMYRELSAGSAQAHQKITLNDLLANGQALAGDKGVCGDEVLCRSTPEGKCVSLKGQLQAIQQEEARCIVTTRRLAKLGVDSALHVRRYFSCYGEVRFVHVPGSTKLVTNPTPKRRASNVGFVVMASAEAACAVLQDGPAHLVCGVMITVQPFQAIPAMLIQSCKLGLDEYRKTLRFARMAHGIRLSNSEALQTNPFNCCICCLCFAACCLI